MNPVLIAREFEGGASETWSHRTAVYWREYVRDMLAGRESATNGRTAAVLVRFPGQGILRIRPLHA
jgi:hypothetical protein